MVTSWFTGYQKVTENYAESSKRKPPNHKAYAGRFGIFFHAA
jgi:hypothetical protein